MSSIFEVYEPLIKLEYKKIFTSCNVFGDTQNRQNS